jgi:adenylate cyclase
VSRRTFSYRISLAVVVATLVAGAGGWVAWWNYHAGLGNTRDTARALFAQVAQSAASSTTSFLSHAPPAAEALRNLDDTAPDPTNERRARRLLAVLRANPSFAWVSYSDDAGTFTGAYRTAPDAYRINRSRIVDGKTRLDEHDVAGDDWRPFRHDDDSKYDPRTRPFFQLARSAGHGVWTAPYLFAGQNVPGVTYALPVSRGDAFAGVLTIDFDLARLSELVRTLAPSEHGRIAIMDDGGTIIAHPTAALASGTDLVALDKLPDDALHAALRAERGTFELADEPYLETSLAAPLPGGGSWRIVVFAPVSDFTGSLRGRVVSSLVISLGVLVLAVAIAWALAGRVSKPLTSLAEDMALVGNFELADRAESRSLFREIEMMNRALDRMKRGLRSFARYVPRDLVRAVLASGREASLSGELRELTVLFSDLAGFTTLAETKPPDELVRFLGGYFEDLSQIIASERGTVDKYLGDGIMAFWGAPEMFPDHAARACVAALRCQRHVDELAARGIHLATRIGIATGEVLVGNVGSPERLNYTAMGDTANLASRLEGLGKQYGVCLLVSEATYERARDAVVARPIDIVAVKGKLRGVRVYELLALTSDDHAEARAIAADATAALDAYAARNFAAAIDAWKRVLARRQDDRASQILIERCTAFIANPPPDRWSAITIVTEK